MFESPEPDDLRDYLRIHELTGSMVARIVGVADSRVVRKWTSPREAASHANMPLSAWILLQLYVGTLSVEQYREHLEN